MNNKAVTNEERKDAERYKLEKEYLELGEEMESILAYSKMLTSIQPEDENSQERKDWFKEYKANSDSFVGVAERVLEIKKLLK